MVQLKGRQKLVGSGLGISVFLRGETEPRDREERSSHFTVPQSIVQGVEALSRYAERGVPDIPAFPVPGFSLKPETGNLSILSSKSLSRLGNRGM